MEKNEGRELDLEEIHEKICDLMCMFHDFCEKHQLRYYLAYGTLIGAIRHKGFIPWDDDFDVQMPREDFIKFVSLFKKEYADSKIYKLCSRANTENYYFGIPRLCDQRFKYVTTKTTILPFDLGVFIDIYPLDNYGDTREEAARLKKQARQLNAKYSVYINKTSSSSKLKTPLRAVCHKLLHIRYGKDFPQKIDSMIYENIKKQTSDKNKYIGVICWDSGTVSYEREWFKNRVLVDFENHKFWAPEKYDEVLRITYGDYMIPPPEEKRVMTHDYKIFERNKSEYMG